MSGGSNISMMETLPNESFFNTKWNMRFVSNPVSFSSFNQILLPDTRSKAFLLTKTLKNALPGFASFIQEIDSGMISSQSQYWVDLTVPQ
jgi:hypothetical protein